MSRRTLNSSPGKSRRSESNVELRREDVGRVVVAVEVPLIPALNPHPAQQRLLEIECAEVHVHAQPEEMRRERGHPVVAGPIPVDAVWTQVGAAIEVGAALRVVAVLVARERAAGDVLAELRIDLVRVDAPVVVVEPVAELQARSIREVLVELDDRVATLAPIGMTLGNDA